MAVTTKSVPLPQDTRQHWDVDFEQVRLVVILAGTDEDLLLFETLYDIYYEQWDDPESWSDTDIAQEAAHRLGIKRNTFYQQLSRMRRRTQQNAEHFLLSA